MEVNAENLRKIREEKGLNQTEFAQILGISYRSYQNYEAGKNIPDAKKLLIAQKLGAENARSINIEALPVEYQGYMLVPLVNQKAQAGFLAGWGDPEYIDELPKKAFEVDKEYKGKYVCFEVSGDSMDDGSSESILENDLILCREVQRIHWKNKLHINRWDFVIVHREQGILVKRIVEHNVEEGKLKLHSLNEYYDDQVVFMDDLVAIFNVIDVKRKRRR